MQPFVTLATLALVVVVGGAPRVVACEDGSYAMDGPVVTAPQQVADCIATNCTIDEQKATPPAQGGSTGTDGATTPKVEKDLKDLSNATVHALEPKASTPPAPPAPK
jgi:hypothetical protein